MSDSSLPSLLIIAILISANAFFLPFSSSPAGIKLYLVHSNSSGGTLQEQLLSDNIQQLKDTEYNSSLPTKVLIHGFWSDRHSHFPSTLREAYLDILPKDSNYIEVDWGALSRPNVDAEAFEQFAFPLSYPVVVVQSIPIVANKIVGFIQNLIHHNQTSLGQVHIIGHSLGAHIAGLVGHTLAQINGGEKISRISGLDPAGPLFDQGVQLQRKLHSTDAHFVDSYHTAMGSRGVSSTDAIVDFYPNGGVHQPGCPSDLTLSYVAPDPFGRGSCSHQFVVDIFAASVRRSIKGCKCDPTLDLEPLDKCFKECPEPLLAGEQCPHTARGQYYFRTTSHPEKEEDV